MKVVWSLKDWQMRPVEIPLRPVPTAEFELSPLGLSRMRPKRVVIYSETAVVLANEKKRYISPSLFRKRTQEGKQGAPDER